MVNYKSNIFEDPGLIKYEMDLAAKRGKNVTRDEAAVTVKNKIQGIDLKKGRP